MSEASDISAVSQDVANNADNAQHILGPEAVGEQLDAATIKQLAADAAWACDLIDRLIAGDGGDETMKPGIVNACEGLAFVRASKGGLGFTVALGNGFVIRKLDQDRFGRSRWSAPVYFCVSQLGVGLAAGYESVETCMALMSSSSVSRFTSEHVMVGTDLGTVTTDGGMSGVPAGTTLGRSSRMDVTADRARACFAYSTANGILANFSINGTQTYPNLELNRKLYGADVSLEDDVLSGRSRAIPEFVPLYRKIQAIGVSALQS